MKTLLTVLISFTFFTITHAQQCGDGKIYASKEQTENDNRFDDYPKIASHPEFNSGEKELEKLIRSQLKTTQEAKTLVFRVNYVVIVGCDGSVKDVKLLGDEQFAGYTNIAEILKATGGQWKPAKKSGTPVDCAYFDKLTVVGAKY